MSAGAPWVIRHLSADIRLVPPLRIERRLPVLQTGAQTFYARAALIVLVKGQDLNLHSPKGDAFNRARGFTAAKPLDEDDLG